MSLVRNATFSGISLGGEMLHGSYFESCSSFGCFENLDLRVGVYVGYGFGYVFYC